MMPIPGTLVTMVMGRSRGDLAMLRMSVGTGALDSAQEYALDTGSLTEIPFKMGKGGCNGLRAYHISFRDFVHQRADAMLTSFAEWETSGSPNGVMEMLLGDKSADIHYEHDTKGILIPGDDGRIYCSNGQILDRDLAVKSTIQGQRLIPAFGGMLMLGLAPDGAMTVFSSATTRPLTKIGIFPGFPKMDAYGNVPDNDRLSAWNTNRFQLDKQVMFDAVAGRLMLIPMTLDRIVRSTINVKQLLDDSGVDYLVPASAPGVLASRGKPYLYHAKALSKTPATFALEAGPEGMKVASDGSLTWTPAKDAAGKYQVVMSITAGGETCLQSFEVFVAP